MALSCVDDLGNRLQSFDLRDEDWRELGTKNQRDRHLRMGCCSAHVVLKRSSRGTRFFAHKSAGQCTSADESEEHRQLKMAAVDAARACGWQAETEVSGTTPTGEIWRADVLARKGKLAVAVEIQWSGQTNQETLRRQEQYRQSGIRGLWLLRQPGFPILHELPAVCIGGTLADGFLALLPDHSRMTARDRSKPDRWRQAVPMKELLRAAFERRLKFAAAIEAFGPHAEVVVHAAVAPCWTDRCDGKTPIITSINVMNPGVNLDFSLAELGNHPDLAAAVMRQLPPSFDRRMIKKRYSRTQRRSYLSNGCIKCDRLFGEYMLAHEPSDVGVLTSFPIDLSGGWMRLIESHPEVEDTTPLWWVQPPAVRLEDHND
jgi:hypothetical protein